MLPGIDLVEEEILQPSLTYKLDFKNKRILGLIDGFEAVYQAVIKRLNTERYAYEIYKDYGVSLETLLGKEFDYVKAVIEHHIKDALLEDERISDVNNFDLKNDNDKLIVTFDVYSYDGFFSLTKEVLL